jgi:hypothetical protein
MVLSKKSPTLPANPWADIEQEKSRHEAANRGRNVVRGRRARPPQKRGATRGVRFFFINFSFDSEFSSLFRISFSELTVFRVSTYLVRKRSKRRKKKTCA